MGLITYEDNGSSLTDAQQSQLASLPTDLSGIESAVALINSILESDDMSLDSLQEVVDFIRANRSDLEMLQGAMPTGGGLTETMIGGATVKHDGSGTAPPTFADNGSGTGTLVSNGNVITSVAGSFNANSGSYTLNHDNPSGIVGGTVYLDANGVSPVSRNTTRASATQMQWTGLVGSNAHSFIWTF